ncbi:hypothetical protein A0H81_06895 [Grifola frondosa]|uniref:Uncharacterized protein n=1 Tax=Grifola frondosa TaxID=5627 RepID=A0A1C7M8H9_GRIFR|nr:hypothetical protein A0H81_06895 [Grifola frondosa]
MPKRLNADTARPTLRESNPSSANHDAQCAGLLHQIPDISREELLMFRRYQVGASVIRGFWGASVARPASAVRINREYLLIRLDSYIPEWSPAVKGDIFTRTVLTRKE